MSGDFAYTRKFLFVAIFVGQKKIQFITKPGGDFSCCGWRSFPGAFPVSSLDTAAVAQKNPTRKLP